MSAESRPRWSAAVYFIFFFSGAAGLGYQIVWTRMFAIGLGHEMPSLLAVVAAFFGGLALGAWLLDRRVSSSKTPGRWYAGLEILIGLWALASIVAIPALNGLAARWIGVEPSPLRHWFLSFAIPLVGLLPATVPMGATFPAMDRLVARLRGRGALVGGVYAVNTAGAVAGTLVTTFVVVPLLGFRASVMLLAAVNFLCAAATAFGPAVGESERRPVGHEFADQPGEARVFATLFATGMLGIGYELLCVRVMGQVLENTVYSFASALSAYLIGTAAGAAVYQRFASKREFAPLMTTLLQLVALSCLLGIFVLSRGSDVYRGVRGTLGGGTFGSIAAELALGLTVFLLPTAFMGATFSHLTQAARRVRGGVGRALGVNTLGSSFAPLSFGVLLLPAAGAKWSLVVVAVGYLALIPAARAKKAIHGAAAAVVAVLFLLPVKLVIVQVPPGHRIVEYREGVMAAVTVLQANNGDRRLLVDNHFFMGGTMGPEADVRQAHLPLLLHPDPKSVLFLGSGTGVTAGAAVHYPGLAVRGVELLPEVLGFLEYFAPANNLEELPADCHVAADARRFVRATDETYDVIVADLFHPARDGAGALYTLEHFQAVRDRLGPAGIFCQWLPLFQLDLDTVRLVTRTFLEVFPEAEAYLGHYSLDTPTLGLVGGKEPTPPAADWLARRSFGPKLLAELKRAELDTEVLLFGFFLGGPDHLASFSEGMPVSTDDHPRVMFQAPYFTYGEEQPSWGRLGPLLDHFENARPTVAPDGTGTADFAARLAAHRRARDLYLRGSMLWQEDREDESLRAFLDSVRADPTFAYAYPTCVNVATTKWATDRDAARAILAELEEIAPENLQAMLTRMDLERRK